MIVKQAIERGELDNLPGEGKPIELHSLNPFETKEERMLNRVIAAAMAATGDLPIEITLLKEIEVIQQKLLDCKSECDRQSLEETITELHLKYNIQRESRLNYIR
jgi:hypothetical protein